MDVLCRLDGVSRSFRSYGQDVPVLRGIDLDIGRQERVGLEGPSGSGKSTLLAIIGLIDAGYEGKHTFDGMDVRSRSERELSGLRLDRIGLALQAPSLVPVLDVRDNVALPAMASGATAPTARTRASELLAELGLEHREGADPATLSGGERRRVAIARALINDPDLVLFDEPEAGLDQGSLSIVRSVLADRGRVRAAVVVTHRADLLDECDRVVALDDGRLGPVQAPTTP